MRRMVCTFIICMQKCREFFLAMCSCADPERRGREPNPPPPPPPWISHKSIGFLSNTGPGPLEITKLPSLHSKLSHYRPVSETAFRWRADDKPLDPRMVLTVFPAYYLFIFLVYFLCVILVCFLFIFLV